MSAGADISAALRILVVDDNVDILESLAAVLKLLGHEVMTVDHGAGAIGAVHAWHPDIALVDVGMPGMSGYDVARAIRTDGLLPQPVLIAMTGWGRDEDKRRAQMAGFDAHLIKPVEFQQLRSCLDALTDRFATADHANQEDRDGHNKQDMNEPTECVRGHQSEPPENEEYDHNRHQHDAPSAQMNAEPERRSEQGMVRFSD